MKSNLYQVAYLYKGRKYAHNKKLGDVSKVQDWCKKIFIPLWRKTISNKENDFVDNIILSVSECVRFVGS